MTQPFTGHSVGPDRRLAGLTFARLVWNVIRVPLLALLRVGGPVMRFVLAAIGLISLLMAGFYHLAGAALPHSPVMGFLGISIGCGIGLTGYERLLRGLSG